jgi:hypothetical protein
MYRNSNFFQRRHFNKNKAELVLCVLRPFLFAYLTGITAAAGNGDAAPHEPVGSCSPDAVGPATQAI